MIVTPGRATGFGSNVDASWRCGVWLEDAQSAFVQRHRSGGEQQNRGEKSEAVFLSVKGHAPETCKPSASSSMVNPLVQDLQCSE